MSRSRDFESPRRSRLPRLAALLGLRPAVLASPGVAEIVSPFQSAEGAAAQPVDSPLDFR
ncbi:hypothetical protein [Halohasta litorea]|uniref:Uncharacterized protein n=1 Tax=Halohasta litorea TaxID=869891 RepID=A0ABD6D4Z4_9EURY|nr:hypothetical protein [Halohasta litorea]